MSRIVDRQVGNRNRKPILRIEFDQKLYTYMDIGHDLS